MKTFIIIALLMTSIVATAQIPFIKPNATDGEKSSSLIYKQFSNQYDFLIAFNITSYWSSKFRYYRILAFKNGIWFKGNYYSKSRKNDRWSKPKIKFTKANIDTANAIIKYFNDRKFWSLNRDTLNISEKKGNGTTTLMMDLSDGANYKFEIISENEFSIIESYEPEELLKFIPELRSREVFINCRDWFLLKYKDL